MPGGASVGVDDDLAAGQPGVALGAADLEAAGRVDDDVDVRRVEIDEVEHRADHVLGDCRGELGERDARRVLGREDDGLDGPRHDSVVADGHLGLAVRAQERQLAGLPDRGQALGEAVRHPDRDGHVLGRLVRRESEHDALVARTLAVERIDSRAGARVEGLVHPWAMSGDCAPIDTSTPQVRLSKETSDEV